MSAADHVFCDTSFLVAAFNSRDNDHEACHSSLLRLVQNSTKLHLSWFVFAETTALLRKCGFPVLTDFLTFLSTLNVESTNGEFHLEMIDEYRRWARKSRVSFCDVISYKLAENHSAEMPIATLDAEFRTVFGTTVLSFQVSS